jgi:hypothetical protein
VCKVGLSRLAFGGAKGGPSALKMAEDTAEQAPTLLGPPKLRAPPARPAGVTSKSVKEIFKEWDRDGNGLIDFEEFQAALNKIKESKDTSRTEQEAILAKRAAQLSLYKEDLESSVEVRFSKLQVGNLAS